MTTSTPNLELSEIQEVDSPAADDFNQTFWSLDAIVQMSVISRTVTAAPTNAVQGDRYIIPTTGVSSGDPWFLYSRCIAYMSPIGWLFKRPRFGWTCLIADESTLDASPPEKLEVTYSGKAWVVSAIAKSTIIDPGTLSPLTTKGDLYGFSTENARIAAGADGQIPVYDSTATAGITPKDLVFSVAPASGCRAYRTTNQSITTATLTAVSCDSEDYDTDNYHESATHPSRLTVPKTGLYQVGCSIVWDSSTTGSRAVYVVKNGTTSTRLAGSDRNATASGAQSLSCTLSLTVSDYVEFYVYQDSGGSVNLVATEQLLQIWAAFVGTIYVPRIPCSATWTRRGSIIQVPAPDGHVYIPRAAVIKAVSLLTDGGVGSCQVDIWKAAVGSYPPTSSNSITASDKPTITSGKSYVDTTLTGWTTAVSAGDCISFNLVSCLNFTQIVCQLHLEET